MKLNDLIDSFTIYKTNEESELLKSLNNPTPIETFTEREQVIIENMIRKSIVSKVRYSNQVLVVVNDQT